MTREIKFRGKRYGDGDWVYGNLYQGTADGKQYSIILNDAGYHVAPQDDRNLAIAFAENEVDVVFTETVGQFSGLLDKNGKEIWEHDIVDWDGVKLLVEFIDGIFCMRENYEDSTLHDILLERDEINVVGNRFDNPELLKTEEL